MEIRVLNGLARVTPDNNTPFNGLSRMNYQLDGYSLNAYSLNGYTLNGGAIDMIEEYCLECDNVGKRPSLNGFLNGKAERKARRAKRAAQKLEKKRQKQARKDAKIYRKDEKQRNKDERKAERNTRRGEMGSQLLATASEIGKGVIDKFIGGGDAADLVSDMVGSGASGAVDDYTPDKSLNIFSPPKLFKEPMKWFGSSRVPIIQKIALVGGVGLAADQLLNKGKLLKKLTGKKK